MRGLTQISLWFWSELLPLPGGGALLATVGLAPRTSQGSPKRVMRKACALSTAQPLASLPGYFYFFPPPPPAELRPRGAGSPPEPVKPAADPGHSLGSRVPEASGCGYVIPPFRPRSSCCVVTRKSRLGNPALSPQTFLCQMHGGQSSWQAMLRVK